MALVQRGTCVYYYISYRVHGRVTSRYVGSGAVALAAAFLDGRHREKLAHNRALHGRRMAALDAELRESKRRARAEAEAVDGLLARWYASVESVFCAAMGAAGYHQHKRTWRKYRMNSQERAEAEGRIRALWDRIESGDPALYQATKQMFDADPGCVAAWGGDLAARVVGGLTGRLAGAHLYRREAVTRMLAQVRADMEGPDPSPVERLLAERAAACWLAVYEADAACQRFSPLVDAKVAEYHERRHDRAHRRFVSAVRALALVRKMALPPRRPVVEFGGRLSGVIAAGRN
jgi:hypothetical protein